MSVKKVAIVIGVLLLPLIYSVTYLKGFWDPYNNLGNMKVAVVNEDKCKDNCKSEVLINKLQESNTFNFVVEDKDKAEKELMKKKNYATITIPEDFTSSLEKASTNNRKIPTIIYRTNKKTNYIAAQLIENAVLRVEKELDKEVAKEVVGNLSDKLNEVPSKTEQISDALGTIYSGTITLNKGAIELANGTNLLNNNSKKISEGLANLNGGLTSLKNGTSSLKEGVNKISAGSEQLKNGSWTLKNNVTTAKENLNSQNQVLMQALSELKSGTSGLSNGLNNYSSSSGIALDSMKEYFNNVIQTSDNQEEIIAAQTYIAIIDSLEQNARSLAMGATNLDSGTDNLIANLTSALVNISGNMNDLENALNELAKGATNLNNSIKTDLLNGVNRIDNGVKDLYSGSNTLSNGYQTFNTGVNSLNSGTQSLKNGTSQLSQGTLTAKEKLESANQKTKEKLQSLDGLDEYTKKPVKFEDDSYGKVDDYGTFFSPFFMSLSLWLGGILIIMGLYYDPEHRFNILGKNSESRVKRFGYYILIGIAQSIILPLVLVWVLNFTVTNWLLFFGSCILIGISFLSLMLFFVFNFDDIGKFLAVVLLVVQLAACAGTFPLETEPAFFGAISPFMPMTYSVELLRESFVSIDKSLLVKDVLVLFGILIFFGSLIIVTGIRKTKKENELKKSKKRKKIKR